MMASMLAGLAMAIALFFLMSGLISAESAASRRPNTTLNLDFIRLNLDEMENIRRRVPPPEPPEVRELQVPPRLVAQPRVPDIRSVPLINATSLDTNALDFTIGTGLGRFTGGLRLGEFDGDGDLYPVLRVSPIYPSWARLRYIEGWVDLEYTVLVDGSVVDPVVIDSSANRTSRTRESMRIPRGVFNDAALEAIVRWRFKPRVINGQPVPVRVVQRINFDLLSIQ